MGASLYEVPVHEQSRGTHITKCWWVFRHRCTVLCCLVCNYFSSITDVPCWNADLKLTEPEGRKHLWSKMRRILHHVHQYIDEYDFFVKADDDTYMIMENLRSALQYYDPEDKTMFGYPFTVCDVRIDRDAGYVLRVTLQTFAMFLFIKHWFGIINIIYSVSWHSQWNYPCLSLF